jgi:hypothetical protein
MLRDNLRSSAGISTASLALVPVPLLWVFSLCARLDARWQCIQLGARTEHGTLEVRQLCGKLAVGFAERAGDVRQLFARL